MKALYFDGTDFAFRDVPEPEPADGESLIRIKLAGICATDIEIGRGYMQYTGIPGHEFVGVVEQSSNASLVGKRIVGEINCACGSCAFCRLGHPRHCSERTVLGILGRDGCFAEYIVLPDKNLHLLPESMTDFEGVMVEPTAAAFRVVQQLPNLPGKRVAVTGDGKLGLLVAQALACEGASVCLLGNHPERRRIVAGRGIEFCPSASVNDAAMQGAFPAAVECTGTPDGPAAALSLLSPLGILVLKTTVTQPLHLPSQRLVVDEISVIGSRCGPFPRAIEALEKKEVEVEAMFDRSFPLEQAAEALKHAAKPGILKTFMTMK
jgi:threonine dehydrogenase-like Zn-dependent dehydrogenase